MNVKKIVAITIFILGYVFFNSCYVFADCPASDMKRELENQKDAIMKECRRLTDQAKEIINVCDESSCRGLMYLKSAENQFAYCWAEASNIYFGWTTFANCESALRQLEPDVKRMERVYESYKEGVDAFNIFVRQNQ